MLASRSPWSPMAAGIWGAMVLPWLNPFAPGPLPPTAQSLFTLTCASLLLWGLISLGREADFSAPAAEAWISAALLSCLIGLLQYFGVSDALSPWVSTTAAGEAVANLRQRNQFATLTNMGLAALLWWSLRQSAATDLTPADGRVRKTGSTYETWASANGVSWTAAAAALLAIGNAASSSRTGLVQLVMLIALAAWWGGLRRRGGQGKREGQRQHGDRETFHAAKSSMPP